MIQCPKPTKQFHERFARHPEESLQVFTEGVETHQIGGHPVRITSVDRTIVDCFKHRSLVGLEVAVEALRERMGNRQGQRRSLQNLHHYSRLMRVARVMQPYMEAML